MFKKFVAWLSKNRKGQPQNPSTVSVEPIVTKRPEEIHFHWHFNDMAQSPTSVAWNILPTSMFEPVTSVAIPNVANPIYDEHLLDSARTQWQFGDWDSLAVLSREEIEGHPERAKLALLAAAGRLQTGQETEARQYILLAKDWGVSKKLISQILIAGVHNSLGRAATIGGQRQRALDHFGNSIRVGEAGTEHRLIKEGRTSQQLLQISLKLPGISLPIHFHNELNSAAISKRGKLFIDCGGYDGCSAIKFLIENDNYECVSFEPNPDLWHYYEDLPVQLIKKAVATYDGVIEFLIDPIDGDGSSYIKEKNVTLGGTIPNSECPKMTVECINLSHYIKNQSNKYKNIVLKMDIEGAEYQVLEDLINSGAIKYIEKLYCEFHWNKIGMQEAQHRDFLAKLMCCVNLISEEWDALDFSIHQNSTNKMINIRKTLVSSLKKNNARKINGLK